MDKNPDGSHLIPEKSHQVLDTENEDLSGNSIINGKAPDLLIGSRPNRKRRLIRPKPREELEKSLQDAGL